MATTTNYGWTTPDNTDLVKDGALAIRTLGSAIDTSMNTALGTKKAGMVLLNTTSFSAVASQSINNVFTSTYRNYRIVFDAKNATAADLSFRLRASGTDLTGNSYLQGRYFAGLQGAIVSNNQGNITQTMWDVNQLGTVSGHFVMDIANPQTTEVTTALTFCAGQYFQVLGQSVLTSNTTSYDGFTISTASTMTGRVSVYGYNN